MFVISGVSGNTGNVVASTLLARRQPVTVIVRDARKGEPWKAQGAEVAVASLEDADAMANVLRGADGAYMLVPPNPTAANFLEDRAQLVDSLADAVARSGVAHVVLLSSIAAQHPDGTGPIRAAHYAEQAISRVARNFTPLRAAFFLENWGQAFDPGQGLLHNFLTPSKAIEMNSVTDIGRIAAELLLDPAHGRRVVEMAGPEAYTPQQISEVFGARLETHPLDAVVPAMTAAGLSTDFASLIREMYSGLNSGLVAYEGTELTRGTVTAQEAANRMRANVAAAKS
jgi:uncharacterized protein YbjT (DUF2867 family)